jgi:hypothetical protein
MWHRLALALGDTVAGLQSRMTSAEFARWVAFYELEGFGSRADDERQAVGLSAALSALGGVAVGPGDLVIDREAAVRRRLAGGSPAPGRDPRAAGLPALGVRRMTREEIAAGVASMRGPAGGSGGSNDKGGG